MSTKELKNKINKSLDELDVLYLESANLILKELVFQQRFETVAVDKNAVAARISRGLTQLDDGEGTDFGMFLKEMQERYGKKK